LISFSSFVVFIKWKRFSDSRQMEKNRNAAFSLPLDGFRPGRPVESINHGYGKFSGHI
jgi:hypothetical protein